MRINEVSKEFGLSQDTLRYYERIGLIPPVPRKSGGIRDYDETSLRWIEFIKCMRSAGLPIDKLIVYVNLYQQGAKTASARKQLLIEERDRLVERITVLETTLALLNGKIKRYDNGEFHSKIPVIDCDKTGI